MKTIHAALIGLLGLLATPALAQPATAIEQTLEGRKTWAQGQAWLVTDDGTRYLLPHDRRNEERQTLAHGWLDDRRVRIRARVTTERGAQTARVSRLLDPVLRRVRAGVLEDSRGRLQLDLGARVLRVEEQFTGPALIRPLVGRTIDVEAFIFESGAALVHGVKARATTWHFQPAFLGTIICIPRWKAPGTEYWVYYRSSDDEVSVGVRHLDASTFDWDSPAPTPPAAAPTPTRGITNSLPGVGR